MGIFGSAKAPAQRAAPVAQAEAEPSAPLDARLQRLLDRHRETPAAKPAPSWLADPQG